jgi:glycosyltransferase 2 family protein
MTSVLKSKKRRWLLVLAWAVASFCIYLVARKLQWDSVLSELKNISPFWLILAVVSNLLILVFGTAQWINFLPKGYHVSFKNMLEINALMAMTSNTVPFLAGQALAVVLLAKREKMGHAVALSVMALDQFAEGFAKMSLFLLVALLTPIPDWMKQGILLAFLGIFILFTVLFFFAHRHRQFKDFMDKRSHPRLETVWRFVSRWAHHLEALRSYKIFSLGMGIALAMKGMEALAIFLVQKSFGLDLPFWTILLVLASISLVTMVPVAPGNLGVYEATVFFVYQFLGLPPEQALGVALVQHVCYLVPLIGSGYLILLIRNFYPHSQQSPTVGTPLTK